MLMPLQEWRRNCLRVYRRSKCLAGSAPVYCLQEDRVEKIVFLPCLRFNHVGPYTRRIQSYFRGSKCKKKKTQQREIVFSRNLSRGQMWKNISKKMQIKTHKKIISFQLWPYCCRKTEANEEFQAARVKKRSDNCIWNWNKYYVCMKFPIQRSSDCQDPQNERDLLALPVSTRVPYRRLGPTPLVPANQHAQPHPSFNPNRGPAAKDLW